MRPEVQSHKPAGFSLPVVIFILVVIAALAGAMARLMGGGGQSVAFEVQSTRAHLAARSGLEWAASALLIGGRDCEVEVNGETIDRDDFKDFPGLSDCETELKCQNIAPDDLHRLDGTCADSSYVYGDTCTVSLFLITSEATCGLSGPEQYQAERNLQWLISKETAQEP